MKIVNRWDSSKVLWEGECDNIREELIAAVKAGSNLSGSDLSGADLSWSDLSGADLSGSDLSWSNLSGSNLSGADLSGSDLYRSNLSGADLSGSNLSGANLSGSNLSGSNLSRSNLSRANLSRADLYRANGINPLRCTPLLMLLDQPGAIRAYKIVNADGCSPHAAALGHTPIMYAVGESYEVAGACTDVNAHCAAGISVATLDWCMCEWQPGQRIMVVEFDAGDIAAIPTATDGKFRLHRCRVVAEKDLAEIGLVEQDAAEVARP